VRAERRISWQTSVAIGLLAVLVLLALPFALHSLSFGLRGLNSDLSGRTYLFSSTHPVSNGAIFGHMMAGAAITLLAPLQLVGPLRARFPAVHRFTGYVFFACAVATAAGGLAYIVTRRTIGGPLMDYAFAGYGLCVLLAAFQTVRYARARDFGRHQRWALRLFVLAIGSWLYRAHYHLWVGLTGGVGIEPGFTGPFDQVQVFAFYVPYLVALELFFRMRGTSARQLA